MIAPCHSLQQNGLHLISPHHHHHDTDRRNEHGDFDDDQYDDGCDADDMLTAEHWQCKLFTNLTKFFQFW